MYQNTLCTKYGLYKVLVSQSTYSLFLKSVRLEFSFDAQTYLKDYFEES